MNEQQAPDEASASSPGPSAEDGDRTGASATAPVHGHRRTVGAFLRFSLWTACFWWIVDQVVFVVRERPAIGSSLATALLASLFCAAFAAALIGTAVGLVATAALSGESPGAAVRRLSRRAWDLAWHGSPDDHRARVGRLLALIALGGAACFASVNITLSLVISVARPVNVAGLVLLCHLGLLLAVAVSAPLLVAVATGLARLLARVPWISWPFAVTGRVVVLLGLAGSLAALGWAYAEREVLAYLPWIDLGIALGSVLLAAATMFAVRRWGPRSQRALRISRSALVALLVLGGIVAALQPSGSSLSYDTTAKSSVARLGLGILGVVLDFDGDGRLPGFGGGDCAPFDRTRYADALDIPDNGIDEDCDGTDLSAKSVTDLKGRWDYAVPPSWPRRPPIVLVTVDAFAARTLMTYGAPRELLPNLDAFARGGVVFEKCFSQGPSTRLSFPAIFTSRFDSKVDQIIVGRHPFEAPSNLTLAEVMQKAGYRTVGVLPNEYFLPGSWKGLTQGFEALESGPALDRAAPHTAQEVTTAAISQLSLPDPRPLFMWIHYFDAHTPHQQPADVPVLGGRTEDVYLAELVHVDRQFGRLIRAIRDKLPGAVIVLTGDHGIGFEGIHEKRGYGHDLGTVVLHVPLVFSAPFLESHRVAALVSTMDITPTLVNALKLAGQSGAAGDRTGTGQSGAAGDRTGTGQSGAAGDRTGTGQSGAAGDRTGTGSYPFFGYSLVPALAGGRLTRPQLLFAQYYLGEEIQHGRDPLRIVSVRTPRYNLVKERFSGRMHAWDWSSDYMEADDLWGDLSASADRDKDLRALKASLDLFVYASYSPPPVSPPQAATVQRLATPLPVPAPSRGVVLTRPNPIRP